MKSKSLFNNSLLLYFLLLIAGAAYYLLSYQTTRENFTQVVILFTILFAMHFIAYKIFSLTHFRQLLVAGIFFRLLLLFSIPNLSDDVYRFIWDGRLAANGINPFSHLPAEIMQMQPVAGLTKELFEKLNSPNYYSIYPPVMQGIFWIVGKLSPINVFDSIILLKCSIVMFDLATFYLLIQLLKILSLSKQLSLLYILNPLVITELTGNVHFDSVMICFLLFAFLLLLQQRLHFSAVLFGLSVASKFVPVIFFPLLIRKLGWKKGLRYTTISGLTTLAMFTFMLDTATVQHLLKSINLFFRNFEFNGSIYYVVRWIGEKIMGYNIIAWSGPALSLIAISLIFFISFRKKIIGKQLFFFKALFIVTIWYLFATTIHPWYICLIVALSVFTPYRFAIIWSFAVVLSYAAYQTIPVQENLWLIAAEYIFVLGYAVWEMKKNDKIRYMGGSIN